MYYGVIKKNDIANGSGVRVSVFVSGCNHHCPGCFNSVAWDFAYGEPYTETTEAQILDSLKPDFMDGLSLCKIVMSEFPDIKVIIISGYSDFEYARQAISIGVERYLLKPVTKADMIAAIEEIKQKISEASEQQNYISKYEQEVREIFPQGILRETGGGFPLCTADLRAGKRASSEPVGQWI